MKKLVLFLALPLLVAVVTLKVASGFASEIVVALDSMLPAPGTWAMLLAGVWMIAAIIYRCGKF